MNTLPKFSKRTIREIQQGKRDTNGRKKVNAVEVWSIAQARDQKVREAIYGKKDNPAGEARKKAIAAADKWFSQFIRLRDSNAEGIATCITCGRMAPWKSMDCGHYASRAKQATRYDELNANAQCGGCNRFQGGKFIEHGDAIDKKHGTLTAMMLRQKALIRCSRTTEDFLFIADTYKKRVAWIAQHEPNKFKKP